jgi:hypothetical protein
MQNGGVPDYTTSNYNEYVNRKQAYNDSLSLYNKYNSGNIEYNKFATNLGLKTWKDTNAYMPGAKIQPISSQGFYFSVGSDTDTDGDGMSNFLKTKDNKEILLPNDLYRKVFTTGAEGNLHGYKKPTQPVTFVPDPKVQEKQKLIGVNPDGVWGTKSEAAWKYYNNKPQTISQPTTSRTSTIESPKQIIPVQPVIDVDAVEKKYMRYFDNGQKPEYWYQIKDKSGKLHSMSETDYNIIKNKKQIGGDPSVPSIGNQKINPGFYNEGGELSLPLSVYKNYVNGVYNNTPVESHGKSVYDKMNRVHLAEAKKNKMNVTNYIMSNIS